jgi:protein subunit release factor A
LEDANIKLSSVLSSTNGAVGTKLIDKICDGEEITMQDVDEVYHKKLAATKEEIFEACQGFITEHHVYMLQIIRQEIAGTQQTIESLTQRIKEVLLPYENALELLKKFRALVPKVLKTL